MKPRSSAAIGIRVKTGRAIAIAIWGDRAAPSFARRAELTLCDARIASSKQPFHVVMELPWEKALIAVKRDEAAVRNAAVASMRDFVLQLKQSNIDPSVAAVVSSSDADAAKIGNPHIRAHAAEGRLFREAAASAARDCGLKVRLFLEDEIADDAARAIAVSTARREKWLAETGAAAGRPWRADEKTTALAAWIALAV